MDGHRENRGFTCTDTNVNEGTKQLENKQYQMMPRSHYTVGVLCADLIARCTLVLDYARMRIAFLPPAATRPEE